MELMMKSNQIWEELENDTSLKTGLLYKRFSADVKPDAFIALKAPERLRCIAFRLNKPFTVDVKNFDTFKDIQIETIPDENNRAKLFLLVLLLNKQHIDIFATLCEDLIAVVSKVKEEVTLIEKLLDRLVKWQSLFEKLARQGLLDEAQRGLFGEIYFLRKYISSTSDIVQCLNTWTGPERAIQDFQYADWAVEVKTTHGKNHQKIQISSERQLDDDIVPHIFLYHLSLDIRSSKGETLNNLVESVIELLTVQTMATNLFKMKLIEAGYFEIHNPLYEEMGYTVRQENIYYVTGHFPRITERQIPIGVGDIRYSIVLTESESWRIDETELFNKIT